MRFLGLMLVGLVATQPALTREVDNFRDLSREARIARDVFAGALDRELGDSYKLREVESTVLAHQGILLELRLSAPWFRMDADTSGPEFHIDGDINLSEVPRMVHDILAELQINIAPLATDTLVEVKTLREEQRALRDEQRELRRELRGARREFVREREEAAREAIEARIQELESELEATDEAYEVLNQDLEVQYERLKNPIPQTARKPEDAPDINLAISRAVCDAGATLRSFDEENYVTVAVQESSSMTYITYLMEHVTECGEQRAGGDKLLTQAWVYGES